MKKVLFGSFLIMILLCLTACGKQKAETVDKGIGNMSFSDESILTASERETLTSLKQRREEALKKNDVKALEAIKEEWITFKEPIEAYIDNFRQIEADFISDKSLLSKNEKEWFDEAEAALRKAYQDRDVEELAAAKKHYDAPEAQSLRDLIREYKAIDQKPFSAVELNLMTTEERKQFQILINDTNTALLDRDLSAMKGLEWSQFKKSIKDGTAKKKDKMVQDWVDNSSFASALGSLFSLGTIKQSTKVQGHKIILTTQYTLEMTGDKQIKADFDSYISLMSSTLQSGVNQLSSYVDDVSLRIEYLNYKSSVVGSKDYTPTSKQQVKAEWGPVYPEKLVPDKGVKLPEMSTAETPSGPSSAATTAAVLVSEPATTPEPTEGSTGEPATTLEPTEEPATEPATTPEPTEKSTTEPATTPGLTEAPATEPATTPEPTEEPETEPETTEEDYSWVVIMKGDVISFGTYEQDNDLSDGGEPIEWIVFAFNDKYVYLLSRFILDVLPFHERLSAVDYETSDIRAWLNDDFIETAFTEEETSRLVLMNVELPHNYDHPSTYQGRDVRDRVALMSIEELKEYFPTERDRLCIGNRYPLNHGLYRGDTGYCPWWTRTMGASSKEATIVKSDGGFNSNGWNVTEDWVGIRPCICLEWDTALEYAARTRSR